MRLMSKTGYLMLPKGTKFMGDNKVIALPPWKLLGDWLKKVIPVNEPIKYTGTLKNTR